MAGFIDPVDARRVLQQFFGGANWPQVAPGGVTAGKGAMYSPRPIAPIVGSAGAAGAVGGYTPSPSVTATAPGRDGLTTTEQLLAQRAREAAAAQQAKSAKAPRVVASRSTASTTKPGAAPSTRGRTVVGAAAPRVTGAGAAGRGVSPTPRAAPATMYSSIPAGLGYPPPTPAYGGANAAQMAGLANYLGYPSAPPVQSQQQIADFIATPGAVTGPVSPYATQNNYGGTSGPPAISVQNSQQAAAIAARNATAEQLGSAEFRATLDQLLREAGLPSQFGTADAQLAARDYRY